MGIGIAYDATAGPSTRGKSIAGHFRAADGHHLLAVAGAIAPADRSGIESTVRFCRLNESLGGLCRGATDSRGGVRCQGKLERSQVFILERSGNRRAKVPHFICAYQLWDVRNI